MKKSTAHIALSLALSAFAMPAIAAAGPRLSCDDLKAKVEAKFQAKGVKHYTLEAVDMKADDSGAKSVGTCDGNTKKMLYKRGAAPAAAPKSDAKADAPKADAKAAAPKADPKPATPAAAPAKPAGK